jgi:PIN domain nuclease of toxin-antitoxin system
VKLLLDTHVFLWIVSADRRLTPTYRTLFEDPDNQLFFSVASCWEIVIKVNLDRLQLPLPATDYVMKQIEANQITLLGIRHSHLKALETLPTLHKDPFDRMILAQALAESMSLLSKDKAMRGYKVRVL